jgi:phage anti-repressor protein
MIRRISERFWNWILGLSKPEKKIASKVKKTKRRTKQIKDVTIDMAKEVNHLKKKRKTKK